MKNTKKKFSVKTTPASNSNTDPVRNMEESTVSLTPTVYLHLIKMITDIGYTLLVELHNQEHEIEWAVGVILNTPNEMDEIIQQLDDTENILRQGEDLDSIVYSLHETLRPFLDVHQSTFYGNKKHGVKSMNKVKKADNYLDFYKNLRFALAKKQAAVYTDDVRAGVQLMAYEHDAGAEPAEAFDKGIRLLANTCLKDEKDNQGKNQVEAVNYMSSVPMQAQVTEVLQQEYPQYSQVFGPLVNAMDWAGIISAQSDYMFGAA